MGPTYIRLFTMKMAAAEHLVMSVLVSGFDLARQDSGPAVTMKQKNHEISSESCYVRRFGGRQGRQFAVALKTHGERREAQKAGSA